MSNKPRKKKHYNKVKIIKKITKGFRMISRESWRTGDDAIVKAYLNGREAGTKVFDHVDKYPRDWKIRVFYDCVAPDGGKYIEESEITARNIRLNDIDDFYKRIKEETRRAVNHQHIVDHGFEAITLN